MGRNNTVGTGVEQDFLVGDWVFGCICIEKRPFADARFRVHLGFRKVNVHWAFPSGFLVVLAFGGLFPVVARARLVEFGCFSLPNGVRAGTPNGAIGKTGTLSVLLWGNSVVFGLSERKRGLEVRNVALQLCNFGFAMFDL